ncbi:MAG: ferric siderophore ABC transporter substrate-binding protein [Bergeyella sp.]|nr:ferric siderophore ABC transporter substrate-binding protein [Bergeyella sp.]
MDHRSGDNTRTKDYMISALLTLTVWAGLLVWLYLYRFRTTEIQERKLTTTMLISFGDKTGRVNTEEPKEEDGSLSTELSLSSPLPEPPEENKANDSKEEKRREFKSSISGLHRERTLRRKKNEIKRESTKKTSKKSPSNTKKKTESANKNNRTAQRDGKGREAIGNLIKGKGNKSGSQGNGKNIGNSGDPLGGNSTGNSKIGTDRNLVAFIPGTMNRGGKQPSHHCKGSGTIVIVYTVDKTGKVTHATRKSGIADPCIVKTSIEWVKKYVKAEKSTTSSTGTYKISF